jgi:dihydrolipoamide dehydrogenase
VKRSRGVSQQLNGGVGFLMKKNKIDVIWGEAKITKVGEVASRQAVEARRAAAEPAAEGHAREGVY